MLKGYCYELFGYIPNGRMGVVLKRTESWDSLFSTAGCLAICHYHLHCHDLLWLVYLLPFSSSFSFLLVFRLLVESSSDVFHFLSCQYRLPPFLCSFFPDIALCILLLHMSYFLAISAWDFLLTMQSPTAIKSSVDCSPMLYTTLFSFFSVLYPYTLGLYSSCMLLGSSYHCPYIDDTFFFSRHFNHG